MKCKFLFTNIASLLLLVGNFALAENYEAENYTLFNSTPDHKLRSMNTERSSKSDYVTTVDAGRVQIETSLVSVVRDKNCNNGDCTKTNIKSFGDTNTIRLGLTQNSDLQILSNLYLDKKTKTAGVIDKKNGFGDINLRFKYSFSGNKNEKFGIAATPFIKIPTNQDNLGNNNFEGGLSIPFVFNFDNGYAIGGMTQFNFLKDQNYSDQHKYYIAYANAVYLSKSFTDKFGGFIEYYTYKADSSGFDWQNTIDFGTYYLINNNLKIDAGFNVGTTNSADDLNYYTGFAYRF